MKSLFKKVCLLLTAYQVLLLIACNKNNCNCPPVENKKYKLTNITADNIIWKTPPKNAYDFDIKYGDTIPVLSYGINVLIETSTVFCKPIPKPCAFINAAYACDCARNTFSIADSVKELRIIANADFGSIKKGNDLSSSFSVLYTTHTNKIAYLSSSEALSSFNYEGVDKLILPQQFICTDKTLKNNLASFTVWIKLKSGIEYSSSTKTVYLQ